MRPPIRHADGPCAVKVNLHNHQRALRQRHTLPGRIILGKVGRLAGVVQDAHQGKAARRGRDAVIPAAHYPIRGQLRQKLEYQRLDRAVYIIITHA